MLKLTKKAFLIIFLMSAAFASCTKKTEIPSKKELDPRTSIQNYDKLLKFISVLQGVSIERVNFNSDKNEFYISGLPYRESLEHLQAFYEISNEYKISYESN